MPDYQKAKIYKLWSPSKNLVYYGSTVQTLSQRLADHIRHYNCKKKNITASLILDCEDYKIELIEEYACNNRQQLERKEGEYIKNNVCVNKVVAGRTEKEYSKDNKEKRNKFCKKWREEHKEELKEYRKNYKKNNPEKIKEGMKIYNENNITKLKEYKKTYYEITKQNNAIYKWLLMTGIIQ
jgi:hypothetical protein